jgi:hypothetical protein
MCSIYLLNHPYTYLMVHTRLKNIHRRVVCSYMKTGSASITLNNWKYLLFYFDIYIYIYIYIYRQTDRQIDSHAIYSDWTLDLSYTCRLQHLWLQIAHWRYRQFTVTIYIALSLLRTVCSSLNTRTETSWSAVPPIRMFTFLSSRTHSVA